MRHICPKCKTEFHEEKILPTYYWVKKICPSCKGIGACGNLADPGIHCLQCRGTGKVSSPFPESLPFFVDCPVCRGIGYREENWCSGCNGKKLLQHTEKSYFCPHCDVQKKVTCSSCSGNGIIDLENHFPEISQRAERCDECNGRGSYHIEIKLDIITGKGVIFKNSVFQRE